jgi:hypothetical protein
MNADKNGSQILKMLEAESGGFGGEKAGTDGVSARTNEGVSSLLGKENPIAVMWASDDLCTEGIRKS